MSNIGCGGAEIQSILLFNGLYRSGFQIRVLILDTERIQLKDRLDEGIEKVFIKRKTYFDLSAASLIKQQIIDYKPDVLVMVDNYPILYGILLKLMGVKIRSIAILHNTVPPNFKRELQNRLLYGPSLNRLDTVVFVSQNQKKYWMDRYRIKPGKARVILNGIDIVHFESYFTANSRASCRNELGIPPDKIVIAMNASLWAHKSHDHMLEALHRLKNEGLELYLIIIGDGPMRKKLEELVIAKDLTENVRFTGFVSDVRPYLMSADISALTSTGTETLSLAAIESMALGKALILSNTGGSSEIVDNGENGYLYKPGDIDELVGSIKRILKSDAYVTMGQKCRKKARDLFTLDRMINQYISLLDGDVSRCDGLNKS